MNPTPETTPHGTPYAKSWTEPWRKTVAQTESNLNRPICGARLTDDTPCTQSPDHENGRCKLHGGHPNTGAVPNNRYAVKHAMHSNRLKTCGPKCPAWSTCPMASKHVEESPPEKRPYCPYELAAYNQTLAPDQDPFDYTGENPENENHDLALVNAIIERAAIGTAAQGIVETRTVTHRNGETDQITKPTVYVTTLHKFLSLKDRLIQTQLQQRKIALAERKQDHQEQTKRPSSPWRPCSPSSPSPFDDEVAENPQPKNPLMHGLFGPIDFDEDLTPQQLQTALKNLNITEQDLAQCGIHLTPQGQLSHPENRPPSPPSPQDPSDQSDRSDPSELPRKAPAQRTPSTLRRSDFLTLAPTHHPRHEALRQEIEQCRQK